MTASAATATPTTSVLLPANGATVSEAIWLDAAASSPVGVASVAFEVSGGTISDQVVGHGTATRYGYIGGWDTRDVPNGTYTLQSVATDTTGVSTTSAPISVTVDNPPLSTTVILAPDPLDSAKGYVLDAAASSGATGVSFQLIVGNGVAGTLAATPTLYGWILVATPTPPCSGITPPPQTCVSAPLAVTIQSVATYAGGVSVTSPGVATDVIVYTHSP